MKTLHLQQSCARLPVAGVPMTDKRTEYLCRVLPNLANFARWSELSYMISMVEKIQKYGLTNCGELRDFMAKELRENRDEFINAPWTREFEKRWMEEYVSL